MLTTVMENQLEIDVAHMTRPVFSVDLNFFGVGFTTYPKFSQKKL
jgi:hypothetical protein